MQIVRVYSGDDGESHFEDLTPEQFAEIVNNVGDGDVNLNSRPSPSFSDYHTAPRRQYVVNMSGTAEFEVADGTVKRLVPGDVLIVSSPPAILATRSRVTWRHAVIENSHRTHARCAIIRASLRALA